MNTRLPLILLSFLAAARFAPEAEAQLTPDWIERLPVGSALLAGAQDMLVDASGTTYVTGNTGSSSNNDAITAAFASDGSLLWQSVYDGPAGWHDQARGLALGPRNVLWMTGNTPGEGSYANVLLLGYDRLTGALLQATIYSSGPFNSEHGASVVADAEGNVYVGGGTVGDGGDGMLLKFDATGTLMWKKVWDGPALAPYSQDQVLQIAMDPEGHTLALIHGVMGSNQPDYVVTEYAPDGSVVWQTNWGGNGGDYPCEMELDAAGDVYVTGTSIGVYATIKLRGSDGGFVWQAYDSAGARDSAIALALDGLGGVYVTGQSDPDGDVSNSNDNIYTVARSALDGALRWTHRYGANCIYCFDSPSDVLVDLEGNAYLAGFTSSPPYGGDLITLRLDASSGVEIERGVLSGGPTEVFSPGILRFDAAYNLYDGAELYDANTGAVDIALVKHATPSTSFYGLGVTNLVAGAPVTFSVTNATPFASQFVIYGLSGAATPPLRVLGTTLWIAGPKLLFWGPANASGVLEKTLTVPPGASGLAIWLQACEPRGSTPPSSHVID